MTFNECVVCHMFDALSPYLLLFADAQLTTFVEKVGVTIALMHEVIIWNNVLTSVAKSLDSPNKCPRHLNGIRSFIQHHHESQLIPKINHNIPLDPINHLPNALTPFIATQFNHRNVLCKTKKRPLGIGMQTFTPNIPLLNTKVPGHRCKIATKPTEVAPAAGHRPHPRPRPNALHDRRQCPPIQYPDTFRSAQTTPNHNL